ELHYRRTVEWKASDLLQRVQELLPGELGSSDPSAVDKCFLIFHLDHMHLYKDQEGPAQTAILMNPDPSDVESYRKEIEQSWQCKSAEDLLRGSANTCLVTELLTQPFSPEVRVQIFHGVLQAMVELTAPDALVFKHTQQVIAPGQYLEACS